MSQNIVVWETISGTVLGEVEQAHYMAITDLDVSQEADLIVTSSKDSKVKVWSISTILSDESKEPLVEFSHTSEVVKVMFSKHDSSRIFTASIDKSFKVFDVPSKICLKTIITPSPISNFAIDSSESNYYISCENQNIY